jgi:hypothetical protein
MEPRSAIGRVATTIQQFLAAESINNGVSAALDGPAPMVASAA